MRFRRTPRFHAAYEKLPARVQAQADAAFLLFRDGVEQPPFHLSLRIQALWEFAGLV